MDTLNIEILPDGTVKTTSAAVSPENHLSAEAFLKLLAELAGGAVDRRLRGDAQVSAQVHVHAQHHMH